MPTKNPTSTAELQLDTKTALKIEEILREALVSSNILVLEDDIAGRIKTNDRAGIIMIDDISGIFTSDARAHIIMVDDLSGRQIMTDDIAGRLSQKDLRKSATVELDAGEAVHFYKHLLASLLGSKASATEGKGSASETKKSTKSKNK